MGWIPFETRDDYDEDDYRRHRITRICLFLCAALVVIVVVLGLATLIVYLILRPKATHYYIVSASVHTLEVIGSKDLTFTSTVNAVFIYGLEAENPNSKVTMEYDKFNVQILYLGTDIGHSSVDGFILGYRSSNVVMVTTSAMNLVVNNIVGNALRGEISQQWVSLTVRIDTRARAHIGSYTSFWMWLHSVCEIIVTPPSNGVSGMLMKYRCRNT